MFAEDARRHLSDRVHRLHAHPWNGLFSAVLGYFIQPILCRKDFVGKPPSQTFRQC
jgi:hypothetical protein